MLFTKLPILLTSISLLCQLVNASVYIVKPDASDSFNAGKRITITWLDNDSQPRANEMGPSTLYLATGSETLHTNLATLGEIEDPGKTLEFPITIDSKWGPSDGRYFILLESKQGKNEETGQPLQAFSARFALHRMTGTFPPSALEQLSETSSTPSSTTTSTSSSSTQSNGNGRQPNEIASPGSTPVSTSAVVGGGGVPAGAETTKGLTPVSTTKDSSAVSGSMIGGGGGVVAFMTTSLMMMLA